MPTFTDFIPTFPTVNRKFLITDFRLLSTSVKRENFIDFYRSQKKVKDPRSLVIAKALAYFAWASITKFSDKTDTWAWRWGRDPEIRVNRSAGSGSGCDPRCISCSCWKCRRFKTFFESLVLTDKRKNLGRVFNFKCWYKYAQSTSWITAKQPNLSRKLVPNNY